ncbi:unnamed protein product [Adineta steineri]|uniref:RING-type domain-containing protein n=1 Tax=Adineta steineri TaxID=433720 RepID=A0A818UXP6_9BILA|nr:unnamed protein product [Adineta steineri]CAF3699061.1 unnamed protein product [Adineta steineri]
MCGHTDQSVHERCSAIIKRVRTQTETCDELSLEKKEAIIQPSKRRFSFKEVDSIKTARTKSFINWPHSTPSRESMASNGWFSCNINDRVICIYCNTICQRWTSNDNPQEVHQRLAPQCAFVLSLSSSSSKPKPLVMDQNVGEPFKPHHASMCEISRRLQTFNNPSWTQSSPTADDLAQAGFFYSGSENTVTCFYCNGSLHKWSAKDSPKIEHCRWFPNCIYARHFCGDPLYFRIQMKKSQLTKTNDEIDQNTLVRLVNARLDLPRVQQLRTQYDLAIIRRVLEDQLKNNHNDSESDNDLAMSCFILKKQIDTLQGNPERIIIPSKNQMSMSTSNSSSRKSDECLICLTEERQIACMPCGHFCACVSCGYSLRSCPVCRENIQSFVRIYC